ncbi:MAG: leucine-rich repeat protein [Clostridia bacterium]|nr:leucine-rich repeat protein [Clostridia bacterium]
MKKVLNTVIAIPVCAVMLFGAVILTHTADIDLPDIGALFATEASAASSGKCGENVTFSLNDEGTLTVSGTGEMMNYLSSSRVPWNWEHKSIKAVIIEQGITSIGDCAFSSCNGLTEVTIPDSVTSIGDNAFYYCDGLTEVTIPDSVTSIGEYAFYGCTGLTEVTIGNGVTSIEEYAFAGCVGLTSIEVDEGNTVYHSSGNCLIETESKTLILGCKNSVIPDDSSVTSIGYRAFYGCNGLTSITVPSSVTSIGDWAFSHCIGLSSVTIGNGVTSIGDDAFYWCQGLTEVTIPDSVTSIGNSAFNSCTKLANVIIGNSVSVIGSNSFRDCALRKITIPRSVKEINIGAFQNCTSLKEVNYTGTKSEWDAVLIGASNEAITDAEINFNAPPEVPVDPGFTLTYDANGGNGAPANQTGKGSVNLSYSAPTRQGYIFLGWATSSTATSAQYDAGSLINLDSNITLYAVWQINNTPSNTDNQDSPSNTANPSIPAGGDDPNVPNNNALINNFTASKPVNYKATVTFTASDSIPEGSTVLWYVNGKYEAQGNTYTNKEATDDYTVQVKVIDANGNVIGETEVETVRVNQNFLAKFIAFFLSLFGALQKIKQ